MAKHVHHVKYEATARTNSETNTWRRFRTAFTVIFETNMDFCKRLIKSFVESQSVVPVKSITKTLIKTSLSGPVFLQKESLTKVTLFTLAYSSANSKLFSLEIQYTIISYRESVTTGANMRTRYSQEAVHFILSYRAVIVPTVPAVLSVNAKKTKRITGVRYWSDATVK